MALACKICDKELDAFSGGRCRKCRQLVCSSCTAQGSATEADGLLCKECAADEQKHEKIQPVDSQPDFEVKKAPLWLWILVLAIIVGGLAYVIITPYIETREAMNAIRNGNEEEYFKALDILANMGGSYALNTLREYIDQDDEPIRSRALRAIGALPGNDPVIYLKKLQTSKNTPNYLKSVIIEALLEHERRHGP